MIDHKKNTNIRTHDIDEVLFARKIIVRFIKKSMDVNKMGCYSNTNAFDSKVLHNCVLEGV